MVDAERLSCVLPGFVEFDPFHSSDRGDVSRVLYCTADHDVSPVAVGTRHEDIRITEACLAKCFKRAPVAMNSSDVVRGRDCLKLVFVVINNGEFMRVSETLRETRPDVTNANDDYAHLCVLLLISARFMSLHVNLS